MDLEFDFEKRYRLIREIIETLVLTILMFLIIRMAVQNFNIDGMSMEPTLHNQELVLVDKWSYVFNTPARGDVIVFVAPPNPTQDYIKRIIGLPGDVVTIRGTEVTVNGKKLDEKYIDPARQGNRYADIVNRIIPPNSYLVLGDNRDGSSDSRDWGCVPKDNIIGRAALVYWPLGQDNNGFLRNVSETFDGIGAPPTKNIDQNNICPVMKRQPLTSNGTAYTPTHTSPAQQPFDMSVILILAMPSTFLAFSALKKRSA